MNKAWAFVGAAMILSACTLAVLSPVIYTRTMDWYRSVGVVVDDRMPLSMFPIIMLLLFAFLGGFCGGIIVFVEKGIKSD